MTEMMGVTVRVKLPAWYGDNEDGFTDSPTALNAVLDNIGNVLGGGYDEDWHPGDLWTCEGEGDYGLSAIETELAALIDLDVEWDAFDDAKYEIEGTLQMWRHGWPQSREWASLQGGSAGMTKEVFEDIAKKYAEAGEVVDQIEAWFPPPWLEHPPKLLDDPVPAPGTPAELVESFIAAAAAALAVSGNEPLPRAVVITTLQAVLDIDGPRAEDLLAAAIAKLAEE
jgi:hypothetical protein